MSDLDALMDDFCETTHYDEKGARWQDTEATFVDPDKVQKYDANELRDAWGRWTESGFGDDSRGLGRAFQMLGIARINGIPEDEPVTSLLTKLVAVSAHAPRMDFVANNGKVQTPTASATPMEAHKCYNNSIRQCIDAMGSDKKVEYVEGYVTEHGVPLAHAWNREDGVNTDHTVGDPWNHQYIGLVIPTKVWMPIATSGRFEQGLGDGVLGTIMSYKSAKKREQYLKLIREANP